MITSNRSMPPGLFQPIRFPGLDERENAHLLCGLKRLNTIAEVRMSRMSRMSLTSR